jgi:hypothetical protein
MERKSVKRSSNVGSEKMERVGDRKGKMEGYCSTGQSPQRAIAPTEEEEEFTKQYYEYWRFEFSMLPNFCPCLPLQPPLAYVNQPKLPVASEE